MLSACAGLNLGLNNLPPGSDYERVGTVSAEQTYWNWFYQMNADERLAGLEKAAQKQAEEQFGDDAVIVIEEADGSWSPASLLMLFNTLGFVEDSRVTASVWKRKPEPEIQEPPVSYGYRYVVVPEGNYEGEWGFMHVEYKTREQLETVLDGKRDSGEIDNSAYERGISRLPQTGKIFITLAREDITNAISRWFAFTCTWNGKTVFRKRGIEDIPYVYGTDRLWWNDMSYNVGPEWDGELNLRIEDSYRNEVFNFKVIRERYIIEETPRVNNPKN